MTESHNTDTYICIRSWQCATAILQHIALFSHYSHDYFNVVSSWFNWGGVCGIKYDSKWTKHQLKDFVGETMTAVWSMMSGDAQRYFIVTVFPLAGVHSAAARRASRNVGKFMARWPNFLEDSFFFFFENESMNLFLSGLRRDPLRTGVNLNAELITSRIWCWKQFGRNTF